MSKIGFSKAGNKKAVMALAVVAMFLATMGVTNVQAASPVSLSTEKTTFDIMEGGEVFVTISIASQDTRYKKMDLYLTATWPGGTAWDTTFLDDNLDDLGNNLVTLQKGSSDTVILKIICNDDCDNGDQNEVEVTGRSDPKWYDHQSGGGSCTGSSDCETDTTPASASSNTTNTLEIILNARTGYSHTVGGCELNDEGTVNVYQGQTNSWAYTLTNTGWNTNNYAFVATVESDSGASVDGWTVNAGLVDGKELTGVDTSLTGSSEIGSSIQVTPAATTVPGTYTIELVVSGNLGGAPDNCKFDVIVPAPDLEIKDTDIDFSHTSAWINTRGDSQKVTIYATVRNNGGNVDTIGTKTNDVTVKFYADSAPIGTAQTVSLNYGEEETISVDWNPGRAHTADEVGLVITVKVDPAADIEESDETNNEGSQFFKVVRTSSSNPSFFMGFFALIGSVAVAVMLSSYYRNKDSEE